MLDWLKEIDREPGWIYSLADGSESTYAATMLIQLGGWLDDGTNWTGCARPSGCGCSGDCAPKG